MWTMLMLVWTEYDNCLCLSILVWYCVHRAGEGFVIYRTRNVQAAAASKTNLEYWHFHGAGNTHPPTVNDLRQPNVTGRADSTRPRCSKLPIAPAL